MVILFCGISFNRKDILKTFEPISKEADVFFIENFKPEDITNSYIYSLGNVLFWNQYKDAFQLLEEVKPDKLVFVLLDNYYHFALYAAAKKKSIPILYLDHGIRFEEEFENLSQLETSRKTTGFQRIKKSNPFVWLSFLKNLFFRNTTRLLDKTEATLMRSIFFFRGKNIHPTFMRAFGENFIPDHFIIYSPTTWRFYKKFFSITNDDGIRVTYTGIPSLDTFISYKFHEKEKRKGVLFIDQPLHEQNLLGWTKVNKYQFLKDLDRVVTKCGHYLVIKPHPWNEDIYTALEKETQIQIIRSEIKKEMIESEISFVGSFNSTLLLPFCAMEEIVTFCMENHPSPVSPSISAGITKYKTAVELKETEHLTSLLTDEKKYLELKNKNIPFFIQDVLYAFDGYSSTRMIKAILE